MDGEEDKNREEELKAMRSGASSPSALSTASSGSPLVRNGSALKRPAPTSIAAAQLECQQRQQQLDLAGRLKIDSRKASAKPSELAKKQPEKGLASVGVPAGEAKTGYRPHEKSFGYHVAKSVAFRAHRFNELWTVNRMRYMNLACLLMTLVCLLTILIFSNGGSSNMNSSTRLSVNLPPASLPARASLASSLEDADDNTETVDSLDSQPLLSGSLNRAPVFGFNENPLTEEGSLKSSEVRRDSKIRRKSIEALENGGAGGATNTDRFSLLEREGAAAGEEGTTIGSSEQQFAVESQESQKRAPSGSEQLPGSLIDPILGHFLGSSLDAGLGPLLRTSRNNWTTNGKPIIRKSKNGATIIISGSFNESSFQDPSFPIQSLLEKLLPPMFAPKLGPFSGGSSSSNSTSGHLRGAATITIASEPMLAASSPLSFSRLSPFGSTFEPFGPFSQRSSAMMDPASFRLPFGFPFPPPSLMSVIMRASEIGPPHGGELTPPSTRSTQAKNEAIGSTSQTNSTQPAKVAARSGVEPEVEIVDLSQLAAKHSRPMQSMYSARPRLLASGHGGSMLLMNAGHLVPAEGARPPIPFPLHLGPPPFLAARPPQMMLVADGQLGAGPLSPLVRSLLSDVMSGLATLPGEDKNRTSERQQRPPEKTRSSPLWSALAGSELEAEEAGGEERWSADEQVPSSRLRARHRDEESVESVNSEVLDPAGASSFVSALDRHLESGLLGGGVRQTFRGPGVVVERVIEVPMSGRAFQQVPAGVRSQSLSRSDLDEPAGDSGFVRGGLPPHPPLFVRHTNDRWLSGDDELTPQIGGLISRLLSDISRRSEPSSIGLRGRSTDEDLDEGDSADEPAPPKLTQQISWPRIRVASARIRMKPLLAAEPRSSQEAIFMPPIHLAIPDSDAGQPERELPSFRHLLGQTGEQHKFANSFEDTLNSMEDRLNHVLSMASQPAREHYRSIATEPADVASKLSLSSQRIISPVSDHQSEAKQSSASEPLKPNQQQPIESHSQQQRKQADSMFTSPTSPLFGFPTSSLASQGSHESSDQSPAAGSNRRHRSFTYHSDNELASSLATISEQSASKKPESNGPDDVGRQATEIRPRFLPAAVVMGRRLDDSPFDQANLQHASYEERNNPAAFASVGISNMNHAASAA